MSNLRVKQFFAGNNWKWVLIFSLCFALLAGSGLSATAYDPTKVKNKSFERDGNKDGIPNAWVPGALTAKDKRTCRRSRHKKCSFKMVANGSDKWLVQETLYSSGPAGIIATASGWMKGKDLVGAGSSWIYLWFNKTGGGTQSCGNFEMVGGSFKWWYGEGDCVAEAPFDSISIAIFTDEDSGKVWFDKVNITAKAP